MRSPVPVSASAAAAHHAARHAPAAALRSSVTASPARALPTCTGPRLALLLLALPLAASACSEAPAPKRPNVLLLSVDSLRRDHVSVLGRVNPAGPDAPTTPAFERLAREGVLFEDAVSTTSWTLPAHMALLTGLPDDLHGVTDNNHTLAEGISTLAELLEARGWSTGGFFSGPNLHPVFGFARGFDVYRNCSEVVTDLELFTSREPGDLRETHRQSHESVTSPRLFEESWGWIEEQLDAGEPFFAFVHWWDPHYDYLAPAEYEELYSEPYSGAMRGNYHAEKSGQWSAADVRHLKNLYDAEIRFTDDHLARLFERLEARGALDDTIVVLTSDHGEEFYEHGRWGHQRTLHEEVVRIPLAVRWPEGVPAGVRPLGQARLQDILPTICELADVAPPPYLEATSLARLWEAPDKAGPLQVLKLRVPFRDISLTGVRGAGWKFLWDRHTGRGQLFRLEGETGEQLTHDVPDPPRSKLPRIQESMAFLDELEARRAALPAARASELEGLPAGLTEELEKMGYLGE